MTAKPIPKSFNLRQFFGDYFDVIRRTGSERAEELVALVEERREGQRCDICGMPMTKAANQPKPFVGAYLCDFCRRELQAR
ncbi:MAG: hypothetical protein FWC40_08500 [Proteobacteria bacterium]|nr:hypothetical protein [Pseudomonadota bacterium]